MMGLLLRNIGQWAEKASTWPPFLWAQEATAFIVYFSEFKRKKLNVKVIGRIAIVTATGFPLLVVSCGASNDGLSEAESRYRSGVALQEAGLLEDAIAAYGETIRLDPRFIPEYSVYNNRGRSFVDMGQYQQAIQDLDEAVRIDSRRVEAYNNRARAYAGLGQLQRAIEDYDRAIMLDFQFSEAYNSRARAYAELGRHQRAIDDLDMYVRLNPQFSPVYNNLGFFYDELGQYDQEIEAYYRGLHRNSDFVLASNSQGQVAIALANRMLANHHLDKAKVVGQDYDRAAARGIERRILRSILKVLGKQ